MGCSCSIPLTDEEDGKDNSIIQTKKFSKFSSKSTFNKPLDNSVDISIDNNSSEEKEIFKKVKKIGKGNKICHSYLIRSKETMEEYAYKVIDISDSNDDSVKKIKNEINVLKELNHPNIILLKNAEISEDRKYLSVFTEYADGGNLQMKLNEHIKSKEYFEESTLLDWLMQICLALKYIHNKNILHRDIKPSNIFLMKENLIKLGDFGVSKVLNSTLKHAKTIVATPQYSAPEILKKEQYSFRADIWSLGVTFFQLIYLIFPFEGTTEEEMQKNILEGKRKEVSCSESYDKKLIDLVNSMLSYRPDDRPSASEILENPIINSRMICYLKENNFDNFIAKKTIDDYENEIEKLNENKKEKQIIIEEDDKIADFINSQKIEENKKKKDKKALYDLSRQMTLMKLEISLRKSNTGK